MNSPRTKARESREHRQLGHHLLNTLLWLVAGFGWVGLTAFVFNYPLNHDVGWFLYMADAMMKGEVLAVDLIEVNMPTYVYLVMVAVWISELIGLPSHLVARWMILVLCFLVAIWGMFLLPRRSGGRLRPVFLATMSVGLLGVAGIDFGQREHLMVVLLVPYVVLATRRLSKFPVGRLTAVGVGLMAGIGISLKPFFILPWAAVEILLLLVRSGRASWAHRVELYVVLATAFIATASVIVLHPEYVQFIWESRHLYRSYALQNHLLLTLHPAGFVALTAFAALLAIRPIEMRIDALGRVLIAVAFGAWVSAILQGKGWTYHFYPALASGVMAGLLLLLGFARNVQVAPERPKLVPGGLAFLMLVVLSAVPSWLLQKQQQAATAVEQRIQNQSQWIEEKRIKSLVVLSSAVEAAFPLVNYTNVRWASPVPSLWWVEALYEGAESEFSFDEIPAAADSVERMLRSSLVDRIDQIRPDAVFVDTAMTGGFGGRSFPYIAYLSQDPRFRELWKGFRADTALGRFKVFRYYRQ